MLVLGVAPVHRAVARCRGTAAGLVALGVPVLVVLAGALLLLPRRWRCPRRCRPSTVGR